MIRATFTDMLLTIFFLNLRSFVVNVLKMLAEFILKPHFVIDIIPQMYIVFTLQCGKTIQTKYCEGNKCTNKPVSYQCTNIHQKIIHQN